MRTLLVLVIGVLVSAVGAQPTVREATYRIVGPEGPMGRAEMRVERPEDGRKVVRLTMTLESGGRSAVVIQESSYRADGSPERMLQDVRQGTRQTRIVASFGPDGVEVTVTADERVDRRTVAAPPGSSRARNEFWFMPNPPVAGAKETYFRFDLAQSAWASVTAQYVGREQIEWNGARIRSHFVLVGETRAYLDDQGMPYRVVNGSTTLERLPE